MTFMFKERFALPPLPLQSLPAPSYPLCLKVRWGCRHALVTHRRYPCATQEDAYAVSVPLGQPGHALFTVCDGHGGAEVARYGALHLVRGRPHTGQLG